MSLLSVLVKSSPRTSLRASSQRLCSHTNYHNSGSSVCRAYSSNAHKNGGNGALSKGIGGFALGVAVTALGFYALQRNTIKLDGQNIGSLRPDSAPKATTERTRKAAPDPTQAPHYASPEDIQQAIKELQEALPGEHTVVTDRKALESYGHSDNSYHPTSPHSVVVRPHSTEDVVKIVNIARKYRIPIVPYSGATSLEGHFSGVRSSYCSQIDRQGSWAILLVSIR